MAVGIRRVGLYLPPIERHNDWWPSDLVARWQRAQYAVAPQRPLTPGEARVAAALREHAGDPFGGVVTRHVMPEDMTVLDMAAEAGRLAIERADVAVQDIDLLLTNTVMPDVLLGNPACQIHDRLGLPRRCFAMETAPPAYSFMMQLTLAQAMIASGQARVALLVQSCAASRWIDPEDPVSPVFGDGATAVVLGPVREGRGLLAADHRADGRFPLTLVAGVPGGRWADPARGMIHIADPVQMRDLLLMTADVLKDSIDTVLARAGLTTSSVGFFAMHQGTPWLREVIQDHVGLSSARWIETFSHIGYLFAAIQPAAFALAERAGLLADNDVVVAASGGTGTTYGAIVMRWGLR